MARPKSAKQYQYEHLLRANQYSGRLTRIYDSYVAEFTKLAETLDIDPKKVFSFADYPEALERCNKTLEKVVRDVEIFFDRATREEWAESNLKNDELVDYLFEKTGIPKERLKTFYNRNAEALRGFQTRVENGFTISDRIWKITDQYKGEIELGKLTSFLDDFGKNWTLAAITEAAENNGRSVRYIEAILERWKRDGFQSERRGEHGGARKHSAGTAGHSGESEKVRRRAEELAKFRAEYNAKIERERKAREAARSAENH